MKPRYIILITGVIFILTSSVKASNLPIRGMAKGEPGIKVGDRAPLVLPELKKANKEGKAVILMLGYPPHCNWCDRMDRIIFETLPPYKGDVVLIQKQVERAWILNPDESGIELKRAYGTTGQPWFFIIDKGGIVRYVSPMWIPQKKLISVLDEILETSAKKDGKEIKEFTLTVTEGINELNDVKFPVWTFNGMVPGPEIRVKEGDKVKIRLMNKSKVKHSIMFHGLHVPFNVLLQEEEPVPPGYEYTYEFIAKPSGTHLYHCNVNMAEHLDRGMYGAFIVEEKEGEKVDRDFTCILDEWNSKQAMGHSHYEAGHPRTIIDYDIVSINGKAVTEKRPYVLDVKKGEGIRVRFINIGYLPHTLRYPEGFTITHEDGYPLPVKRRETSLTIIPGKRYDITVKAGMEGKWPFYHSIKLIKPVGVKAVSFKNQDIIKEEEAGIILNVRGQHIKSQ